MTNGGTRWSSVSKETERYNRNDHKLEKFPHISVEVVYQNRHEMYPSQRCNTRYIKYPIYFKMQLYLSPGYFIDKVWIVNKFQSHVALHQKYWAIFSMQVSITYEVVGVGCRLCSFDEKWLLQHHHAIMAMSKTSVWYFWWNITALAILKVGYQIFDVKIMIGNRYLSASNVQNTQYFLCLSSGREIQMHNIRNAFTKIQMDLCQQFRKNIPF